MTEDRTQGDWDQTKVVVKEMVGKITVATASTEVSAQARSGTRDKLESESATPRTCFATRCSDRRTGETVQRAGAAFVDRAR